MNGFNRNRFYFVLERGDHVKHLQWDDFSSDWIEAGYNVVAWYRV